MSETFRKLPCITVLLSLLGLTALAAWAATAVNVTASLTYWCSNCQTDAGAFTIYNYTDSGTRPYSLVGDGLGPYPPSAEIQSQILTNNSVYTLDTTLTLVNGLVAPSTRRVTMHFFSPVECGLNGCPYPNNILPPCWEGNHDQSQAVNWSVFAPTPFMKMVRGQKYAGMARLNFNVRSAECDRQVNRFRLEWPIVCITRPSDGVWVVTSQSCSSTTLNIGESHLQGYGGTKKNTVDYGDWRMPFALNLTK